MTPLIRTALALLGLLTVSTSNSSAPESPNIVLILADDLGYGDVAANNPQSRIPTPNLDRLAAAGIRFTDAHAGGSVCVPSRYSLLTGRFSARADLQVRNGPVIEDSRMTIASLLRSHGYATAMVGKWHQGFATLPGRSQEMFDYSTPLRGGPVDRGFDSFFGMHASLDIPPYFFIRDRSAVMAPTETVDAGTSVGGEEDWNKIQGAFWRAGPVAPDFKHAEVTPRFAGEAVEMIRSHDAGNKEKPLFFYLALPSPHTPWLPLDEFRGKSGAGMYGDFVMQVDAVVGRVMAALDDAGLAGNTMVIFSSDNGPVWYDKDIERFGHKATAGLRGMKGSSWEGGHRVPFIVRWPGRTNPGTVSEQTIAFSDLFATLAELVGQKHIPDTVAEDSVSFLPYLLDSTKAPEVRPAIVHNRWTLRDGDWKLILPRNKRALGGGNTAKLGGELYNLREDLAEQHNRMQDEPERARRMQARLETMLAR